MKTVKIREIEKITTPYAYNRKVEFTMPDGLKEIREDVKYESDAAEDWEDLLEILEDQGVLKIERDSE